MLGRWVGERRKETERQRQTKGLIGLHLQRVLDLIGLHLQLVLDGRTVLSVLLPYNISFM